MLSTARTTRAALAAGAALLVGSVALAPGAGARGPASAGSGYTDTAATGSGYRAEASVRYSGDAAPGGAAPRPLPPRCWWDEVEGAPAQDPAAMAGWFARAAAERTARGTAGELGAPADWEEAVAREQGGEDLTWYRARCAGDAGEGDLLELTGRTYSAGPDLDLPVVFGAFPAGRPPAPLLDPRELARRSAEEMVIARPWVERNPRSSEEDASLVGVPTWFWVDEEVVGGPAGTRTIRAEAGGLWVEVTATTRGLRLEAPSETVVCDPVRATRAWSPGAADADGCTVTFQRSSAGSPGGAPVEVSTRWSATYRASDGSSGELEDIVRTAEVAVPVAESQSLVSSAG